MHNLRESLLKAGLVTQEQVSKVEAEKSGRRRSKGPRDAQRPAPRMLDLSDPKQLEIARAIEAHKVRDGTRGDVPFHFALRDGRVRKMFVSKETQSALESGSLAIVENGEAEAHVIVSAEAIPAISAVDPQVVRFLAGLATAS